MSVFDFAMGLILGSAMNQKVKPAPYQAPAHIHSEKCGKPEHWQACEHINMVIWPDCTQGMIQVASCGICCKSFRSNEKEIIK